MQDSLFQKIISSKLFKNLSVVFSETVVTKILNFVIILLLTRQLGPEEYGKYSFIFVTMAFCSSFFDFGMENTAVRFANKKSETRNSIFGLYLFVKMLILFGIILVLMLFGGQFFALIHKSELTKYIPFLIIGILGESLFFVNDTYLQAVQKFTLRAYLNICKYSLSLIFIVILFLEKLLYLKYVFCMYFIPLGITILFIPKYIEFLKNYFSKNLPTEMLKEIFNYEKWMFVLSIGTNTLQKIDFFMISYWVSYIQIGIYNAAIQLAAVVSFLPYVFGKVLLPKLAEMENPEICSFIKKSDKILILACIVMTLCIPLTDFVVSVLLGEQYVLSIPVLKILLFAFILTFYVAPTEQALYALGLPKIITQGRYIQLFTLIGLNFLMIPKFGIVGSAFSVLMIRILYLFFVVTRFYKEAKRYKV